MNTHPNNAARLSLAAAILTVSFFCVGFAPFLPMTALVCYPAAFASGIFSLVSGLLGLRKPSARWMSWTGILTGSAIILAVIAFTTLTALLAPVLFEGLFELWQTAQPQ
jgi:hypothetical protein